MTEGIAFSETTRVFPAVNAGLTDLVCVRDKVRTGLGKGRDPARNPARFLQVIPEISLKNATKVANMQLKYFVSS